jgi:hypothetical protein
MSTQEEKKLDAVIKHLTEVGDGGYPGNSLWIGETLAYTSANTCDEYACQLGSITRKEMLAWYDRAAAFLEKHAAFGGDISSALYETEAR